MTGHAVRRALWLLLLPLAALAQSPQGGFSPETTHTVRPGETLWGISGKYLGRPLLWPGVQQSNRVGEPRSLQIGRLLRFAGDEREAFVLAVIGDVRGAQGQPLTLGTRLPEGALVRTGPDSFITLRLPDGSRTTLPSNSTVRLVRFFNDGGKSAVLLDLDAGGIESRVPAGARPKPEDAYRVRTRMATVAVRGTYFRVSLPDERNAAVSVLESNVSVDAPGRERQSLPQAQGLLAGASPLAGVVQDLLPPPTWIDAGASQNQPGVMLAWNGVGGADSYRAQVASDPDFTDILAEQRVSRSGERESALFEGLATGSYFARVTAVTPEGLEGLIAVSGFSRAQAALGGTTRRLATGEVEFSWTPVPGGTYALEVADDAAFDRIVVKVDGLQSGIARVEGLSPGGYFWRVTGQVIAHGQRSESVGPVQPLRVDGAR